MKDMAGAFDSKVNEFKNRYDWQVKTLQLYHDVNDDREKKGLPPLPPDRFTTSKPYTDAYNEHRKLYAEGAPASSAVGPTTAPAAIAPTVPGERPTQAAIESRAGAAGYGPNESGRAIAAPPALTVIQQQLFEMKKKRDAAKAQTTS